MPVFSDSESRRASFSAVLLAGGRSTRMGRDKAWLPWPERPLWEMQLAKLRALQPTELLVSARAEPQIAGPDFRTIHDAQPDCGPLGGLSAALDGITTDWLLVLAVDLPAMTVAFLEKLLQSALTTARGQVPETAHGLEPLAAVYARATAAEARTRLAAQRFALRDFVRAQIDENRLAIYPVSAAEEPLFQNLNRPEDLPPPSVPPG